MRRLRLVVLAGGRTLPVLLAAAVVPLASCGLKPDGDAGAVNPSSDAMMVALSPDGSPPNPRACDFTVDLPPPGVPAEPGAICAVNVQPVESSAAARITISRDAASYGLASGFLAVDPALAADVVGIPQITAQAPDPRLSNAEITSIQAVPGGYSFRIRWPALDVPDASAQPSVAQSQVTITFRATFEIACPAGGTDAAAVDGGTDLRLVTAVTYVEPCLGSGVFEWVSSGSMCSVCSIVAEMAPSPIVPDKSHDDLPLGRAMRLHVVPVARVGRTVVLFAENDGGGDLDYAWHPSGGALRRIAEDVIAWTPPESDGPHAIQVAVQGDETAAVATFTWEEAA